MSAAPSVVTYEKLVGLTPKQIRALPRDTQFDSAAKMVVEMVRLENLPQNQPISGVKVC